jgi:ATP synthase subunit 6
MLFKIFFESPLEQFQVFPLFKLSFNFFDISITNETVILVLIFIISFVFFYSCANQKDQSFFLIPSVWQSFIEIIYSLIMSLVIDNIKSNQNAKFFPLIFFLFLFILSLNTIGLIPYSFTLTSHLIVTLVLSISVFIGINIICLKFHGINFFSLFLPSGTSVALSFLLIPIEFISYIFKPVSLSIRLFANMMAGHTLLKVIVGFSYILLGSTGILFLLQFIPLLILIPLFGLELGVALIQSFVFSTLICIYLNDCINLH